MASERLDTAEKIVRMTEWNEWDAWEYAEGEVGPTGDSLSAAKRFLSAQSFLLAWVEGKVPTGWRRPRRLADFDGKYPKQVLQKAESVIAERIATRNSEQTARINAVVSAARERMRDSAGTDASDMTSDQVNVSCLPSEVSAKNNTIVSGTPSSLQHAKKEIAVNVTAEEKKPARINMNDVIAVKEELAAFNEQLRDAKTSLRAASDVVAEVTLRLNALSEVVNRAA